MTGLHVGTVAMSIHNAIFVTDRPMPAAELHRFLQRTWDERLDLTEVEDAIAQMIDRGRLAIAAETDDVKLYDVVLRSPDGKRTAAPDRIRDATGSHYGWF
jgi:hypothetical protein